MSQLNHNHLSGGKEKGQRAVMLAFLTLAWPTVLEQFMGAILQYVDTAMVGRLGAKATATVSLSATYTWLINSMMSALGLAFLAFIARAIGEKNEIKIHKAACQALFMALILGILLTVSALWAAPYMPVWMGAEEGIRRNASIYFALINAPLLLRTALIVFGAILRSTGDTKTPMKINLLVNFSNMIMNYIFIYACSMGAIGAGVATAISFCIGGVLMIYAYFKNPVLNVGLTLKKEGIREILPTAYILKPVMSLAIPMLITRVASCSGYIVFTSFVSSMPTIVYAAHSIAITAEELFYIPAYGMQQATSTLIGNALGEGDRKKEKAVIGSALIVITVLMFFTGIILFYSAGFMMSLFTKDAEVIRIGSMLLRIVALTEPIYGAAVVMEGAFAGLGRTKFPLFVEIFCRWGVRIFGSYVMIHFLAGNIIEIWYAMIADNIIRAILLGAVLLFVMNKKKEG